MSREDWKETTLGEICEVIRRGKQPRYVQQGLAVVNQKCIRNDRVLQTEHLRFTDTEQVNVPEVLYLRNGDVVVNSTGTGTVGRSALIADLDGELTLDSHVTLLRPITELVLGDYLFADVLMKEQDLINAATGSTNQVELSARAIKVLPVHLPPIEEQREIANFMQALDHMLQAGDREISSAEQMRRDVLDALLDPAEQNWEEIELGERISITRRNVKPENFGSKTIPLYSIPGFDSGKFPQETKSDSVKSAKLEVDENSILVSLLNPRIPRVSRAVTPGFCSTEFAVVKPDDGLDFDFLYYLISGTKFSHYLTQASRGTTGSRTRSKREDILNYPVSVPPLGEQEKIVEKMQTLDAYIDSATRSQEALNQVRKDALHALLSGDKDVSYFAEMLVTDEDVA